MGVLCWLMGCGVLYSQSLDSLQGERDTEREVALRYGRGMTLGDSLQTASNRSIHPKIGSTKAHHLPFLCRMELEAEEKMQLPIWIKVGEGHITDFWKQKDAAASYVQFKWIRF